jgi:hypothetical protein
MEDKIALIAGDGNLPVVIASRLTDMGTPPVVYSVREKWATYQNLRLKS